MRFAETPPFSRSVRRAPTPSREDPLRIVLRFWLRLGAGVAVLAFVLHRIDFSGLSVRPDLTLAGGLAVAIALLFLSQALSALRWKVLLGPNGPSWRYLTRLYLIGLFFSLFLPTSVGGDAMRAAASTGATGSAGSSIASVLLDRLFGVAALVEYAMLGIALAPGYARAVVGTLTCHLPSRTIMFAGLGTFLLCAALVPLAMRSPRVRRLWQTGVNLVATVARAPGIMWRATLLGLAVQGCFILMWMALAVDLAFRLPVTVFLVGVPLVNLGTMLPVTLSGLGIREGIWLLLLAGYGLPAADVVVYSLLYFLCNVLVGFAGGFLFVRTGVSEISAAGRAG